MCEFSTELVSWLDQELLPGEAAAAYVQRLAEEKAQAIWNLHKSDDTAEDRDDPLVVLGADTCVASEGNILGKPVDASFFMTNATFQVFANGPSGTTTQTLIDGPASGGSKATPVSSRAAASGKRNAIMVALRKRQRTEAGIRESLPKDNGSGTGLL